MQSYLRDAFVGPLKTQMSASTPWCGCVAPSINTNELRLSIMLLPQLYAISTEKQLVGCVWINFPFPVEHTQAKPLD